VSFFSEIQYLQIDQNLSHFSMRPNHYHNKSVNLFLPFCTNENPLYIFIYTQPRPQLLVLLVQRKLNFLLSITLFRIILVFFSTYLQCNEIKSNITIKTVGIGN
jgi:hypothetical protein